MWRNGGKGFCDLSINTDSLQYKLLNKLGYSTIALNTLIDESAFETKKKNKKGASKEIIDPIPPPKVSIPNLNDKLKVFHRLTIKFSDPSVLLKLNQSENLKKYDFIAAMPTDFAAFTHACTVMDVDVITFDCEDYDNFRIHRKLYNQAVERGIYFEIMYSPALKHSNFRRNIINKANIYKTIGKSKNIIIASGAENEFQIRGPFEVIKLGYIFGLSQQQAISAITENPRKMLLKGDSRRRGKSAVFIVSKNCDENSIVISDENDEPSLKKMKIT